MVSPEAFGGVEAILRELQKDRDALAWEVVELRIRLAKAGLDSSPPDAVMTARRVRALEDAVDAAREVLRRDPDRTPEASHALYLCNESRGVQ